MDSAKFYTMIYKSGLTTILLIAFCLSSPGQAKEIDNSRRVIICLTYDDGLTTQLSTVIS